MKIVGKNLSYTYPYTYFDVLNNLSFAFDSGEMVFLYAHEGGGKTTLLKAILGLIDVEGELLLDGKDLKSTPINARNIAYCDHSFMLFLNRSVRYNLEYPLKIRKIDKDSRREILARVEASIAAEAKVGEVGAKSGMGFDLNQKVKDLDYLSRLKLALIRLDIIKRDIILFDEIFWEAEGEERAAAEILSEFVSKNTDKIIIFATSVSTEADLFPLARKYTLDIGKIVKGVIHETEN